VKRCRGRAIRSARTARNVELLTAVLGAVCYPSETRTVAVHLDTHHPGFDVFSRSNRSPLANDFRSAALSITDRKPQALAWFA